MDITLKLADVAIVFATFAGPIAAVQAQKWVERRREQNNRRITIFRTLMATRAASLSPAHVEALNAIPIEFYGSRRAFKQVVDAWKSYLDYLSQQGVDPMFGRRSGTTSSSSFCGSSLCLSGIASRRLNCSERSIHQWLT